MPDRMPDLLVLVRHGESSWNAERRLQGQLDPPLSQLGRTQAIALTPLIAHADWPAERVLCSDLGRARETAELLGLAPGRFEPAWREIDVGEWGGRVAAEVDAESTDLTNWRGGPRTAPGGESWSVFADRIATAAEALIAAGGSWLVICHGGCVRATCAHLVGADRLALGSPPNASVTTFELSPRPRLLTYGATPDAELPTGLY
jgi:broad specificity phosphatase PhoE